jgi:hypothetical protein
MNMEIKIGNLLELSTEAACKSKKGKFGWSKITDFLVRYRVWP